jgi:hypothetical protein
MSGHDGNRGQGVALWLPWLLRPLTDTYRGLDRCMAAGGWRALAAIGCGLVAGWWIYVPVHELLHAAACAAAGGEVKRLEIAAAFGGAALARLLPFVAAGSGDYAGRLSGFDTHGSDLVYLATDLGPYLLTVFPGVWWLRRAARGAGGDRPFRGMFAFGAALPVALAPFLSLSGDAYEIGSIVVTRLPPWTSPAVRLLLRGDDLGLRWQAIAAAALPAALRDGPGTAVWTWWAGALLAAGLGLAWAVLTYGAGSLAAAGAGEPPLGAVGTGPAGGTAGVAGTAGIAGSTGTASTAGSTGDAGGASDAAPPAPGSERAPGTARRRGVQVSTRR